MRLLGTWTCLGVVVAGLVWCAAGAAQGPSESWQGQPAPRPGAAVRPAVQPDQPVAPQYPQFQRRADVQGEPRPGQPGAPAVQTVPLPPRYPAPAGVPAATAGAGDPRPVAATPPQPPFVLSLDEQRQLDQVLTAWEQRNKEVKRFECNVTKWRYDSVFPTNKPEPEPGVIKYAAPDKGMIRIDGKQPMHWICDGRSIYSYEYATGKGEKNKVREYPLPPELQGKGIADGPLPFVFGTEAQKLKQRYFLRLITPRDVQGEIWLEARPRLQRDAADFSKAELILKADGMQPFAVQLYDPNPKDRTVYQFDKVIINRRPFPLEPDPFRPTVPFGWQKVVEQASAQAARAQVGGNR